MRDSGPVFKCERVNLIPTESKLPPVRERLETWLNDNGREGFHLFSIDYSRRATPLHSITLRKDTVPRRATYHVQEIPVNAYAHEIAEVLNREAAAGFERIEVVRIEGVRPLHVFVKAGEAVPKPPRPAREFHSDLNLFNVPHQNIVEAVNLHIAECQHKILHVERLGGSHSLRFFCREDAPRRNLQCVKVQRDHETRGKPWGKLFEIVEGIDPTAAILSDGLPIYWAEASERTPTGLANADYGLFIIERPWA